MQNKPKESFKETHGIEKRKKIVEDAIKKNPNCMVIVIERAKKHIESLPELLHSRFVVNRSQSML